MTIVAEFPEFADISAAFEEEISGLEQKAEDLQIQADIIVKEANVVLEQVGLKRQQQSRTLKALVEIKQGVKECLRLGAELGPSAELIIQREIAAWVGIPIATPPEPEHPPILVPVFDDDVPSEMNPNPPFTQKLPVQVSAFFADLHQHTVPDQVEIPEPLTDTEVEPPVLPETADFPISTEEDLFDEVAFKELLEEKDPFDLALDEVLSEIRSESPFLPEQECEKDPFELAFDEAIKTETRSDSASLPAQECETKTEAELEKEFDDWLYDRPKSEEVSEPVPRVLSQKEKEANAYKKNVEEQKARLRLPRVERSENLVGAKVIPFAESIGITIEVPDTLPQLVEISNRMTFISGTEDGEHKQACYIGGANEANLKAWGKWLTLSPKIATHAEVRSSKRIMKFKHELKVVGMSLEQLKVLKAEGMQALPPREKTQASKALGQKLLDA